MTGELEGVGRMVKQARQQRKMSQQAVAEALNQRIAENYFHTTIGKIEKGKRGISLVEAVALAELLGIDWSDIYEELRTDKVWEFPATVNKNCEEYAEEIEALRTTAYARTRKSLLDFGTFLQNSSSEELSKHQEMSLEREELISLIKKSIRELSDYQSQINDIANGIRTVGHDILFVKGGDKPPEKVTLVHDEQTES